MNEVRRADVCPGKSTEDLADRDVADSVLGRKLLVRDRSAASMNLADLGLGEAVTALLFSTQDALGVAAQEVRVAPR